MKQITSILFSVAAIILSFSCFAQNGFDYQIKGNISELKNDSVIVFIRNPDKAGTIKVDTIVTVGKNDEFLIQGHSNDVHDAAVTIGGYR